MKCHNCKGQVVVRDMPPDHPPTVECDCMIYAPFYGPEGRIMWRMTEK